MISNILEIGEAFMSLADLFLGGGLYFRGVVYVRFFLYLCELIDDGV